MASLEERKEAVHCKSSRREEFFYKEQFHGWDEMDEQRKKRGFMVSY